VEPKAVGLVLGTTVLRSQSVPFSYEVRLSLPKLSAMANSLTHIKIYGWVKIVLGIVSFCLQVYIAANYQDRYANVAAGIWGGLIFLLTGATTIYTLNNITRYSVLILKKHHLLPADFYFIHTHTVRL